MTKFSPLLANDLSGRGEEEVVGVDVRGAQPLTDEQVREIENLGLSVGTRAGSVFTCRGPVRAVRALEKLEFVRSVDGGSLWPA